MFLQKFGQLAKNSNWIRTPHLSCNMEEYERIEITYRRIGENSRESEKIRDNTNKSKNDSERIRKNTKVYENLLDTREKKIRKIAGERFRANSREYK